MKNKKFTTLILALTILIGLFFSMCSKTNDASVLSTTNSVANKKNDSNSSVIGNEKNSAELAIKISKDPDWVAYKATSQELLLILVKTKINFHTLDYSDTEKFYTLLGPNATIYKEKLTIAKNHAKKVYEKYFSEDKTCPTCNVITEQKKIAIANVLDNIRNDYNNSSSKEALAEGPSCWNLEFFACGTVCATTIEFPPAFVACMYLCYKSYCN